MAKVTKRQRKQKKKWFNLLASPEFKNQLIGECMAFEPGDLPGRTVKVNLSSLSRDMRRQSKKLTFRIKEVKEADAHTELYKYEIAPMHIKRIVRKEKDKVDDSFVVQTKDKIKVILKPMLLTKAHTQNSVHTALRKAARKLLEKEAKAKTYSEFVLQIINGLLQKSMKSELKKVYPIVVAEIRALQKI